MKYIQPVSNMEEKKETYRTWLGKFNKAIQYEFYYEALLIDYAMMEDRLRSYLYHMGLLNTRDSHKVDNKKATACIQSILVEYGDQEKPSMGIGSITGKRNILKAVLRWSINVENLEPNQKYLYALKSQCESLDTEELLNQISKMEKWCDYRNEIIHALMNKSIGSVNEQLREKTLEGKAIARYLDDQLKIFKRGNKVRKSLNLNMN